MAEGERSSGLLLHMTSLPSRYGIGDLGPAADSFLDALAAAGQSYWQMLPIGPTGYANSPYQGVSTFAGNTLLLSPEVLIEEGLLKRSEPETLALPKGAKVDYGMVLEHKLPLLATVARRFLESADSAELERLEAYRADHGSGWLSDFALFAAIKSENEGRPWTDWPSDLATRHPLALEAARIRLRDQVEVNETLQYLFSRQWGRLRSKAARTGISLVGDLPLYVAHDSADVWANQALFLLDQDGMPEVVAGVPPDYFSETGQRWGNPIYDWPAMEELSFSWWRRRIEHVLSQFDLVRIDHFRGIAGYYEIPAMEQTAIKGRWRKGPGSALLDALSNDSRELPIIAEDLGVITDDVIDLRERYELPGMRIAQFGFDDAPDSSLHHPESYPEPVWAYTGTHDNNTTNGWFWEENPGHDVATLDPLRRGLLDLVGADVSWGLMELVAQSKARCSVFPVQDLLGLGPEGRMNTPSTTEGNWEWRLGERELESPLLERLHGLTESTGRLPRAASR